MQVARQIVLGTTATEYICVTYLSLAHVSMLPAETTLREMISCGSHAWHVCSVDGPAQSEQRNCVGSKIYVEATSRIMLSIGFHIGSALPGFPLTVYELQEIHLAHAARGPKLQATIERNPKMKVRKYHCWNP